MTTDTNGTATNGRQMKAASLTATAIPRRARWLAFSAVSGSVLFTFSWFILGFVSPGYSLWGIRIAPYSAVSQPISGLGFGITGPVMNTAFVLGGILILAGVVGIFQSIRELSTTTRLICTLLLALSPLGMAMDGIFTLESILPHLVGFFLGCATPVLSFLVIGFALRRIPQWRRFGSWLLAGSPLTLVLVIVSFATFDPIKAGAGVGVAGLTERLLIVEVCAWLVAMGWMAFRRGGPLSSTNEEGYGLNHALGEV